MYGGIAASHRHSPSQHHSRSLHSQPVAGGCRRRFDCGSRCCSTPSRCRGSARRYGGAPCGRPGSTGSGCRPSCRQRTLHHGLYCPAVQRSALGLPAQEIQQERQRRQAIELDTLLFILLDTGFDGLAGVVQAAFNSTLAGLHQFGDLFYTALVVVIEQHAHPLLRGQAIHQFLDHALCLRIVQRLVRHLLLIQVLISIQKAVAFLVLRNRLLLWASGQLVPASVDRDLTHPPPEGLRSLQGPQLLIDGQQDLLSRVPRVLLTGQHLSAQIVAPFLHRTKENVSFSPVALHTSLDQFMVDLLFHVFLHTPTLFL